MSIEGIADAPRNEITIKGLTFRAPAPFSEGHVLRENEASVLNQTLAENLRNNFASKVEAAKKAAEEAGTEVDLAALQTEFDTYAVSYDFGVRQPGSGVARTSDPVLREAINIAAKKIREALKKKGHNLKDIPNEKIREMAKQAVAQHPELMERARVIVEAQSLENLDI